MYFLSFDFKVIEPYPGACRTKSIAPGQKASGQKVLDIGQKVYLIYL